MSENLGPTLRKRADQYNTEDNTFERARVRLVHRMQQEAEAGKYGLEANVHVRASIADAVASRLVNYFRSHSITVEMHDVTFPSNENIKEFVFHFSW